MFDVRLPIAPVPIAGSRDGYIALVRDFVSAGLQIVDFETFDASAGHLLLRHDIDLSLEAALTMARAEHEQGWRATYFVMVSSPFYNLLNARAKSCLQEILALGHEVGLHFDPTSYEESDQLEDHVVAEQDLLESVIADRVRLVTPHRPARFAPHWLGNDFRPGGMVNGYGSRFFGQACYLSDSDGTWRHGPPHVAWRNCTKPALHLLTHPYIWMSPHPCDRNAAIDYALGRHAHDRLVEASEQFSGFRTTERT